MTREDSIYWLEVLKTHSEKRGAQNITEALNMAVDALRKSEPSNSEKPNNSTISKMEQVDKDINVRSKDEPKTQMKTQNSNLTFEKADEPQTKLCRECDDYAGDGMYCASNHIVYDFSTSKGNCEPQTEDEILREQCRAFMGIVEQTKRGE